MGWISKVRLGLLMLLAGWFGLVLAYLLPSVYWMVVRTPGNSGAFQDPTPLCFLLPSILLLAIGVWVAPPAGASYIVFGRMDDWRLLTRVLHAVTMGLWIAEIATQAILPGILGFMAFVAFWFCGVEWACEIAARAPMGGRRLHPIYPWLPVASAVVVMFAVASLAEIILIAAYALLAIGWIATAYVMLRAYRAVSRAHRLMLSRAEASP